MIPTLDRTFSSPLGPLRARAQSGALVGLYLPAQPGPTPLPAGDSIAAETLILDQLEQELSEYFSGRRQRFEVALGPTGTAFQLAVWTALRTIPYATTLSYRGLAEHVGKPTASRAVGSANGRNPISILVPCHRVVGSQGALCGYAGGLAAKEWLLAHERRSHGSHCS